MAPRDRQPNSTLGANAGRGYAVNPGTGQPYAPQVVRRGDFARVLAEFWADGPTSETPSGHWNVIANTVSDDPRLAHRLGGVGPAVDRLEWDVKLYLAPPSALHRITCPRRTSCAGATAYATIRVSSRRCFADTPTTMPRPMPH
jgi:hypothetical protein